jgi:hypothetical protein
MKGRLERARPDDRVGIEIGLGRGALLDPVDVLSRMDRFENIARNRR